MRQSGAEERQQNRRGRDRFADTETVQWRDLDVTVAHGARSEISRQTMQTPR